MAEIVKGFAFLFLGTLAIGGILVALDFMTDGGRDKLGPVKFAGFFGLCWLIGRFLS